MTAAPQPSFGRAWTAAQRRAVELFGCDVLVSAGAGTGKTAVLAERVLRMVGDPDTGVTVDRLLVVTFTRSAAAEMRRRIAVGLTDRLSPDPAGLHAQRQLVLLDRAAIGTLHSFCARLLREHYPQLGLDPAFRVASVGHARRLRARALAATFEAAYADGSAVGRAFREWVSQYAHGLSDDGLAETVSALDEFQLGLPDPDRWRTEVLGGLMSLSLPSVTRLPDRLLTPLRAVLVRDLGRLTAMATRAVEAAERSSATRSVATDLLRPVAEYLRTLLTGLGQLTRTAESAGFDAVAAALAEFDLGRRPPLPRAEAAAPSAPATAPLADLRGRLDELRDRWSSLLAKWAGFSEARLLADLRVTAPHVRTLLETTARFRAECDRLKREANVLDFADLERLTLRLLGQPGSADSPITARLRARYDQLLVDECQDLSPVQDAIVTRLSATGSAGPAERVGNVFRVGDLKQSLYRFRQAEPQLWADRLTAAAASTVGTAASPTGEPPTARRVDLAENFRARPAVLAAINALMDRLMTPTLGGVDFIREGRLMAAVAEPEPSAESAAVAAAGAEPSASLKSPAVELHLLDREGSAVPPAEADDELGDEVGAEPDAADAEAVGEASAGAEGRADRSADREADWVAARIRAMVVGREFAIRDAQSGRARPVRFGDVVILLRAWRGRVDAFADALRRVDVPVSAVRLGWSQSPEVRDVCNLLRVLDNPRRDGPLLGLLRSPMLGFADAELAGVRLADRTGDVWSALSAAAAVSIGGIGDAGLAAKAQSALARLRTWRAAAATGTPPADLVAKIFDELGTLAWVTGLPDGPRRQAELLHLLGRLRRWSDVGDESTEPTLSVGRLAALADALEDADADDGELGPDPASQSEHDAVRILSVHRAKGLEFPVVFLPDLGRRFPLREGEGDARWDRRLGVGLTAVSRASSVGGVPGAVPNVLQSRTRTPSLSYLLIADAQRQEALSEELRILYVGMTRARDVLVLSATGSVGRDMPRWSRFAGAAGGAATEAGPLPVDVTATARSPADWVLTAALAAGLPVTVTPTASVPAPAAPPAATRPRAAAVELSPEAADAGAAIVARLGWRYPHEPLTRLPASWTVTALHDRIRRSERVGSAPLRPRFLLDAAARSEPTAAEIGVGVHALLERIDLTGSLDVAAFAALRDRLAAEGILPPTVAERVPLDRLAAFFESEPGRAMRARPMDTLREAAVSFRLPAGQVEPSLAGADAEEPVQVRGVLDALVPVAEGYWLLDYKTDAAADLPESLRANAESYRPQLSLYRFAVERAWGRPVVRATLCYVLAGRYVNV